MRNGNSTLGGHTRSHEHQDSWKTQTSLGPWPDLPDGLARSPGEVGLGVGVVAHVDTDTRAEISQNIHEETF